MSVAGLRVTFGYALNLESETETPSGIQLRDLECIFEGLESTDLFLTYAIDNEESISPVRLKLDSETGNRWKLEDSIELTESFSFVELTLLDGEDKLGSKLFAEKEFTELYSDSERVNFFFKGDPDIPGIQASMNVYIEQFSGIRAMQDDEWAPTTLAEISQALATMQSNLLSISDDSRNKVLATSYLGVLFSRRFGITNNLRDVDAAISFHQRALDLTNRYHPGDKPLKIQLLMSLFESLQARYGIAADPDDFRAMVLSQEELLELAPSDHLIVTMALGSMSASYLLRFERSEDLDDIDRAIELMTEAISRVPDTSSDVLIPLLSNMANCYIQRFCVVKDPEDIEKSIEYRQKALDIIPFNHPTRNVLMSNLAGSFVTRFREKGEMNDFDSALSIRKEALQATPESDPFFPDILCNMGNSFFRRFERTKALEDIDEAISLLQRGVNYTAEGDAFMPRRITDLGNIYLERAKFTKIPDDAEKAIEKFRYALALTPERHPDYTSRLDRLIEAFSDCFELLDDIKDIDEAISLQNVHITSVNPTRRPAELYNLAGFLARRFLLSSRVTDIQEAIASQQEAMQLTSVSNLMREKIARRQRYLLYILAEHTKNLQDIDAALAFSKYSLDLFPEAEITESTGQGKISTLWLLRFRSSMELSDIDQAISNQQKIVELSTDKIHCRYLAVLLLNRFRFAGNPEDIEETIDILQDSFGLTFSNITEHLKNICYLAQKYMSDYYEAGTIDSFENGTTLYEEALRRCPLNHELYPVILGSIGSGLLSRFQLSGEIDDINSAVSTLSRARELTSTDSPDIHSKVHDIGRVLLVRFEHTGNKDDLDGSVALLEEAIEKAPKESPVMPLYLGDLGNSLLRVFLLNGNQNALETAIGLLRKALDISLSGDHTNVYMHMSHLGNCLLRRFELTGDFADIDEAVSLQQSAVQATVTSHVPLRVNLMNLGNAYFARSRARESLDDLSEAVATFRKVGNMVKNEAGTIKPAILDNLAGALGDLYNLVKDPALLQEAIETLEESLEITPADHPFKPIQFNNLSVLYRRRYQDTNDLRNIKLIIDILNLALEHPARTLMLEMTAFENLTWATMARFKRTKDIADLDASIAYHEYAQEKMPETHFNYIGSLTSLAMTWETRYQQTDEIADLNKAIYLYQRAATSPNGAASQRLPAARRWAETLAGLGDPDALDGYRVALELLPTVAWLGETVSERHEKLSTWSSLTNEAAAVAILWNRLDLALQWLEEGRNIVWNQLNSFRTPLDDLHDAYPDLANELRTISKKLEQLGSRSKKEGNRMTLEQKINVQAEARMQRDLAEKWEKTLSIVRTLDGFEDFLRPARISKLFEMTPPEGTVVVINVDRIRCDAIALNERSEEIVHIALEKLTYEKAERLRRTLIDCLAEHGVRSRGVRSGRPSNPTKIYSPFEDILIQLWVLVVRPIIIELGLLHSSKPPRIWWCATGPLAFLPIHAAGIYSGSGAGPGSIVSDYVVSSYTPTLSTVFARAQSKAPRNLNKLLIITQPNTPNMGLLPQTVEEGRGIQRKLQASGVDVEYLEGVKATVDKVVESMEGSNWIHLACHAVQDPKHPTKSAFYLHDGRLELSTLINKQLPHADFAFLSACETGTGDEALPEEAVHLAAGVLQAGYQSVVATMWAIDDNYAPMIAESLYSILLQRSNPPNSADAAYALQEAAKKVRQQMGNSDNSFLTWVPFIHFGV